MTIEETIIGYLNQEFGNTGAEKPLHQIPAYKVVEKTGESWSNKIRTATIAVQCIEPSLAEAAEEAEAVNVAMTEDFIKKPGVFSCDLISSYNFTNTATREYRYQSIFSIAY